MSFASRKISVGPLVRGARNRRPAQETMQQTQKIVAEVRAEVARNPEFAPFADRPATDMHRIVRSAEPASAVSRMLRSLQASLRGTRVAAR